MSQVSVIHSTSQSLINLFNKHVLTSYSVLLLLGLDARDEAECKADTCSPRISHLFNIIALIITPLVSFLATLLCSPTLSLLIAYYHFYF